MFFVWLSIQWNHPFTDNSYFSDGSCIGSCIEDISNHLLPHLSLHPWMHNCSSDTILKVIEKLTTNNITYTSNPGKNYNFNATKEVNALLLDTLFIRQLDT